ncbi:hypothetical protein HaLaN_17806 [Haematococcus lacustris]|uniref:Uncharacterized protein n=1 Tax=Haematococcus lacustris TaxID=44745 RepID=A0A699ZES2_HAELA|nr:hypothetical protein HaLaN_17806 [Haematococcus lacustris]
MQGDDENPGHGSDVDAHGDSHVNASVASSQCTTVVVLAYITVYTNAKYDCVPSLWNHTNCFLWLTDSRAAKDSYTGAGPHTRMSAPARPRCSQCACALPDASISRTRIEGIGALEDRRMLVLGSIATHTYNSMVNVCQASNTCCPQSPASCTSCSAVMAIS